jgi:hypothetical protein
LRRLNNAAGATKKLTNETSHNSALGNQAGSTIEQCRGDLVGKFRIRDYSRHCQRAESFRAGTGMKPKRVAPKNTAIPPKMPTMTIPGAEVHHRTLNTSATLRTGRRDSRRCRRRNS